MTRRSRGPQYASRLVVLYLDEMKRRGIDTAPLIEKYAVSFHEISPSATSATLRLFDFYKLADEAALLTNDPWFGLHMAQNVPRGQYGLAEFILRAASTLHEGMAKLVTYNSLFNAGANFEFHANDKEVRLEHSVPGAPLALSRQPNEYSITMLLRLAREVTGTPIVPLAVKFAHEAPKDIAELVSFLGTSKVEFSASHNALHYEAQALLAPMESADSHLHEFLAKQANALLAALPQRTTTVALVTARLHELIKGADVTLERVAAALRMSARTLQRRLDDEHTTFHAVLDDTRHKLAERYLTNKKLGVTEVAYLLGYSELRAFDRAFQRWTGKTLKQWKAKRGK